MPSAASGSRMRGGTVSPKRTSWYSERSNTTAVAPARARARAVAAPAGPPPTIKASTGCESCFGSFIAHLAIADWKGGSIRGWSRFKPSGETELARRLRGEIVEQALLLHLLQSLGLAGDLMLFRGDRQEALRFPVSVRRRRITP